MPDPYIPIDWAALPRDLAPDVLEQYLLADLAQTAGYPSDWTPGEDPTP